MHELTLGSQHRHRALVLPQGDDGIDLVNFPVEDIFSEVQTGSVEGAGGEEAGKTGIGV